ncbi:MAG: selenide, water dikinase SelD [Spirirestis rafaelensis WJT71-NPBG6]|jgi:selenide,water dikinase|nr:selenide, water dikinase SelD [Spirirestis rafaelensis WJT71-NPBG6]
MQQDTHPIVKDLVLIGGGHSHAIALRMFAMKPLPGVRLTLITEASDTPYSGMLPGHIAGFYTHDECHIDLRRLAQFAQAQLYIDKVVGLDLKNNKVFCANRPPVAFDVLSIDIGSTPATLSVSGAEYAIPAKPVAQLLKHWYQLLEDVAEKPKELIRIGVVGGGAGGVELALSMQANLLKIGDWEKNFSHLEIHLFQRDAELMPHYHPSMRRLVTQLLTKRGIQLHLRESVCKVAPNNFTSTSYEPAEKGELNIICESGLKVKCDRLFWVTQASATQWLKTTQLATDDQGFILVDDTLRSLTHPHVFAAGDIATMVNHPRPKAGVFAVRQGKPLFENLQRILLGKSPKPYKPQKQYLSLIGTGDKRAIATRGFLTLPPHKLLWHLKDSIDRQFMQRFSEGLATRDWGLGIKRNLQNFFSPPPPLLPSPTPPCAGCGSKVGSTVLKEVLHRIKQEQLIGKDRKDIIIGLDTPDDAAVIKIENNQLMVQTIDYFPTLINDPYIFGQISANHCLSDILAMGAIPQSALAIATIPHAAPSKIAETLYQLLSGAVKVLNQAQAPLIGGHTTQGAELAFGLTCNGLVYPDKLLRKSGMQPGEVLILTKALGTGTLFAAQMRHQVKNRWIDAAVESMLLSQAAAACLLSHQATACTDVTGFGLLGHLLEMVQASGVAVELQLEAIPILEGASETLQQGIFSSLHPENLQASGYICNLAQTESHSNYPILFDPQTAGGLLASIPEAQAEECLIALKDLGYKHSCIIGRVNYEVEGKKPITLIE